MNIVFGLGNIGREYEKTRHNVGFMVVDELARRHEARFRPDRYRISDIAKIKVAGRPVMLVKPATYMNDSGRAVAACLDRAGDELRDPESFILVVYDDVALDFGRVRLKARGSAGGQKGMESIIGALGSEDFPRLRVGIRNERVPADLAGFVLDRFTKEEQAALGAVVTAAADMVEACVRRGVDRVANEYNGKNLLECEIKEGNE